MHHIRLFQKNSLKSTTFVGNKKVIKMSVLSCRPLSLTTTIWPKDASSVDWALAQTLSFHQFFACVAIKSTQVYRYANDMFDSCRTSSSAPSAVNKLSLKRRCLLANGGILSPRRVWWCYFWMHRNNFNFWHLMELQHFLPFCGTPKNPSILKKMYQPTKNDPNNEQRCTRYELKKKCFWTPFWIHLLSFSYRAGQVWW